MGKNLERETLLKVEKTLQGEYSYESEFFDLYSFLNELHLKYKNLARKGIEICDSELNFELRGNLRNPVDKLIDVLKKIYYIEEKFKKYAEIISEFHEYSNKVSQRYPNFSKNYYPIISLN